MTRKPYTIAELHAIDNERARREAEERNSALRINNVVDAIEAFTDAKMSYPLMRYGARNTRHIDETREHLRDKLAELIA